MKLTLLQKQQIDKLRERLNLEYEFEIVPVKLESYSQPLQYYSNTATKVIKDGGKVHYGWSVHFNKGLIIEAERHAVWEDDEGELICVTTNPEDNNEIIFLSDDTPVDPKLQIDNIRQNITNNPLVDDWIFVANSIGSIYYHFTDRLDNEQVIAESPVLELIQRLELTKGDIWELIKEKRKERTLCFCSNGKYNRRYIDCHSKNLRGVIAKNISEIEQFRKR